MAYSRSPAVARREEPDLQRLLSGGMQAWLDMTEDDAAKRAYRFRQARHIMLRHPQQFGKLARIIGSYRFEVKGCEVRAIPVTASQNSYALSSVGSQVSDTEHLPYTINNPTLEQLIQCWIDQGMVSGKIRATNCQLSNKEIERLEKWADAMEPALRVTISHDEVTIE